MDQDGIHPARTKPSVSTNVTSVTSNSNRKTETPKPAISNSRWHAFKKCLIVLAPIPITVLFVTLNFIQLFVWDSENGTQLQVDEFQNVLQFAAHGLGILIGMSVAAIILHNIRYQLSERDGIPLGFLLTGYQPSHITTLFTKEFWVGLRGNRSNRPRHWSLGVLFIWALFMASVASPFAAMVVIPKINWWPVSWAMVVKETTAEQQGMPIMYSFVANRSELWPTHLMTSFLPDPSCLTTNATQNPACPGAGYSVIADTLLNANSVFKGIWNITFFNDGVARNLASYAYPYKLSPITSSVSVTASVGQVIARSLVDYYQWDYVNWKLTMSSQNGKNILKPIVQVECHATLAGDSKLYFPYGAFWWAPLSTISNGTLWSVNENNITNFTIGLAQKPVQFKWIDLSKYSQGPSLGAVFRLNNSVVYTNLTTGSQASYRFSDAIFTCTVDARWAPVSPSMSPLYNNIVSPDYPFDPPSQKGSNFTQISIDPAWAEALNIQLPNSDFTMMESLINSITPSSIVYDTLQQDFTGGFFLEEVSAALGLMITEGLSRVGWNEQFAFQYNNTSPVYFLYSNGNWSNVTQSTSDPRWIPLNFEINRYGYSYSTSTVTVKIAIAFLLLHGLVALIHTLIVCAAPRVWICHSWDTVGQLVALALNSRPNRDKLPNTCAGVDSADTWKQPLKIRHVGNGNLELVVGHEEGVEESGEKGPTTVYEKPVPNIVYGDFACENFLICICRSITANSEHRKSTWVHEC